MKKSELKAKRDELLKVESLTDVQAAELKEVNEKLAELKAKGVKPTTNDDTTDETDDDALFSRMTSKINNAFASKISYHIHGKAVDTGNGLEWEQTKEDIDNNFKSDVKLSKTFTLVYRQAKGQRQTKIDYSFSDMEIINGKVKFSDNFRKKLKEIDKIETSDDFKPYPAIEFNLIDGVETSFIPVSLTELKAYIVENPTSICIQLDKRHISPKKGAANQFTAFWSPSAKRKNPKT